MPTTYGNDIVYCLKSHCGVRGYCRQKWVLQVQIICKFSNERTCKRNKDVQGLSCGFEVYYSHSDLVCNHIVCTTGTISETERNARLSQPLLCRRSSEGAPTGYLYTQGWCCQTQGGGDYLWQCMVYEQCESDGFHVHRPTAGGCWIRRSQHQPSQIGR